MKTWELSLILSSNTFFSSPTHLWEHGGGHSRSCKTVAFQASLRFRHSTNSITFKTDFDNEQLCEGSRGSERLFQFSPKLLVQQSVDVACILRVRVWEAATRLRSASQPKHVDQ